jgi:hypothetical protein
MEDTTMIELLTTYNLKQLIIYTAIMVIAVKGCWDMIDFFKKKYKEKFKKDYEFEVNKENLKKQHEAYTEQHQQLMTNYNTIEQKVDNLTETMNHGFDIINKRIDALTVSDMHDIKSSIVKDYHHYVENQKWIDDFSLDTLELRFQDYKDEGGNSYIAGLMSEIRQLPKCPPAK